MSIELNKVTWYSRVAAVILFIIIFPVFAFYFGYKFRQIEDAWKQAQVSQDRLIQVTSHQIK